MAIVIMSVLLLGALILLYMAFTEMINFLQTRVPFVPTQSVDLEDMAQRLSITELDVVFDLGSGNGKVLFTVENLTGARTKGFQRAGWTQMYARLKKLFTRSRAELVSGNFFDHSWQDATVVYAYLYPFLMRQVGDKAGLDCQPGTKLVVRDFAVPQLKPTEQWQTPSGHQMYLYIL